MVDVDELRVCLLCVYFDLTTTALVRILGLTKETSG